MFAFCPVQAFAQSGAQNKLQSGFYIENHLDTALEQEFCQKSDLNKRKTIDYWSQKAGFVSQKFSITHNDFPEGEHRLFFDPKENMRAEAAYKLGILYGSTLCNRADINKAKYYLKKSGSKAESRFAYAMILLREKGKLSDIYKLFLEAGALGIGEAYYNAAILVYKKDSQKYAKKIITLLRKSSENGYARAANDLGVFMLSNKGAKILLKPSDHYNKQTVKTYLSYAKKNIKDAADKNDPYALFNYAALLSQGTCHNATEVKILLEKSMDLDFAPAMKSYKQLVQKDCFKARQPKKTLIEIASLMMDKETNILNGKSKLGFKMNPD